MKHLRSITRTARLSIERPLVGLVFLCLLVLGGIRSEAAFAESTLLPPIPLGKAPGAVAVDPARHLAFVADDDPPRLHVVDLAKRRVIGSVTLGAGPADVAVDVELGLILALDPAKRSLRLIDQESGREVGAVAIGSIPISVGVDATSHHAVVLEAQTGRLVVVDLVKQQVVRIVSVGAGLRAVAVHEPTHTAIVLKGESLLVYDFLTGERTGDLTLPAPGTALAVLPDPAWAVVALETPHGIILVDIAALQVLATLSLSSAQSLAVHPQTGESVAIDTGSKTLLRISLQDRLVLEKLDLPAEPLSVAVDPGLHLAVVPVHSEAGGFLQLVQLPVPPASAEAAKSVAGARQAGASGRAGPGAAAPGAPSPPAGTTVLMGRVLDTGRRPLADVTVRLGERAVKTDAGGNFMIVGPPPGDHLVMLEGSTASTPAAAYPHIPVKVRIDEGRVTEFPYVPHLHAQKRHAFVDIRDKDRERRHTDPSIPGFEMRIPPGAEIIGWDGKPNKRVNVRTVPADRLPIPPLPEHVKAPRVFMFHFDKPGGGVATEPIPVTLPNDIGLKPGDQAVLWYFDEAQNLSEATFTWRPFGTGAVSPDGKTIVSDPGVGIPRFCCGAITASAGGGETGGGGCNLGGGGGGGGPFGGDPVELSSGSFFLRVTDLVLPGPRPVPFVRTYRSRDVRKTAFGWTGMSHNFELWVYGDAQTYLILTSPGNYRHRFNIHPDDTALPLGSRRFINTTDPHLRGAVFKGAFDANGLALRFRDGATWKFNAGGYLVSDADRLGRTITIARDTDNKVTKVTGPTGHSMALTYSYQGIAWRLIRVDDSLGRSVQYEHTPVGNCFTTACPSPNTLLLTAVTHPDGSVTRYVYNQNGWIWKLVNPRGITQVENLYSQDGRVVRQVHADGGEFAFSYTTDAQANVTETRMTGPNGGLWTHRFNASGYETSRTDPLGATTTFHRDGNIQTGITDALGRKTTWTFDALGNLATVTAPDGSTTAYTYEPAFSQVASVTNALGQTTFYSHDAQGNVTSVTDPLGNVTQIGYNSMGQPTSVTDPLGSKTTLEYDAQGNLVKTTDPLGSGVTRSYDALGLVSSMTDPLGRTTSYGYDLRDRLTAVTDPAGGVTTYLYDPNGNLLQVTDAKGQEMAFTYTLRDKAASFTDGLGRAEVYGHDASDNLTTVVDRKGQTATYTYDQANRRTGAIYPDGSTVTYTRDAAGRITEINDSISGQIRYTYGTFGCGSGGCGGEGGDRVVKEETPQGTVSYTFDAVGRRTGMTATVGASPVSAQSYEYDAASRLTSITQGAQTVTMSYDAASRRMSLALPNGVQTSYGYDSASRVLQILHQKAGTILENVQYQYDASGSRTGYQRTNPHPPLPDELGATFDSANEMLSLGDLSGQGGASFQYDANGNLASRTDVCGTTSYSWDGRNRLVGMSGYEPDCSSLVASFKYDALGRRTEKTINGQTTQYLYDGLDVAAEVQAGAATATYLRSLNIDEPFARTKSGTTSYYLQDALGSVIGLADATGALATTYAYDAFGGTTVAGAASDQPFKYTGREDDGTGLYYYRARYYSPQMRRFISEDPIGLDGGDENFYAYVGNDPANWTDPTGNYVQVIVQVAVRLAPYVPRIGPIFFLPPVQPQQCKDDDDKCDKLLATDTATCNGITRRRGGEAGARCHASASQRYAACLRGQPIPPLDTWNN